MTRRRARPSPPPDNKPLRHHRGSSRLSRQSALWLLLCTLVAFAGCQHEDEQEPERPAVPVRAAVVEKRKLLPSFIVIGAVMADPQRQATLSSATPGLVDKLVAREG